MKTKDMEIYEKLLQERRKELLKQALSGKTGKLDEEQAADFLDTAGRTSALELMSALKHNERREVEEISLALEKIKDGTYGKCEGCGEEIAPARLEALPTAGLCRNCKAEQERTSRDTRHSQPRLRATLDDRLPSTDDDDDERNEKIERDERDER